ncbi:ABC transporter permease [Tumebacillus permanentifrigoris]|uniref:ABC-2 type transport system permease protein n=1 Tax=Tumebacillus permanentifrigoris TaxID=378543 RepID=A0A316DG09_9BACL|nr:ABC-2 family transporter protein [Tumebacillus permanentifrigoris]PWK16472.1 ABC-2 type transport system permease protein [Tumebacillus permanentifrigoris]
MALYWKLVKASLKSQLQYKLAFAFEVVMFMIMQALDFLLVAAILLKFDTVGGWDLYEVGYLFSIASLVRSLYRVFANEIHSFEKYTKNGEFDQLLTRPVSPLVLLFSRGINWNQIGGFLQGVLMLMFALWGLHEQGASIWAALLYLPVSILSGALIVFSLGLATATIGFWTVKINELLAFTHYGPLNAASYPMHIYPGWLRGVLFTLIPVAFIAYVPSLYLFDKGGALWYLLVSPLIAFVVAGLALRFWKFGIKHYHSTGS